MQVQTSITSSQVAQSSVILGRHDQEFSLRKQKLINQVAQIDLGPIKFKLVHEDSIDITSLNAMEDLYRKYLVMTQLFPDKTIVPTKFIDTMWHAHILDTAKYRVDCQSALGVFLDHFPYLGLRGEEDVVRLATSFSNTQTFSLKSSVLISVVNLQVAKLQNVVVLPVVVVIAIRLRYMNVQH